MPVGGGHCCGFAVATGNQKFGYATDLTGVALSLLEGAVLADIANCEAGQQSDLSSRILALVWDKVFATSD